MWKAQHGDYFVNINAPVQSQRAKDEFWRKLRCSKANPRSKVKKHYCKIKNAKWNELRQKRSFTLYNYSSIASLQCQQATLPRWKERGRNGADQQDAPVQSQINRLHVQICFSSRSKFESNGANKVSSHGSHDDPTFTHKQRPWEHIRAVHTFEQSSPQPLLKPHSSNGSSTDRNRRFKDRDRSLDPRCKKNPWGPWWNTWLEPIEQDR